jgi:plastocyanin
MNTKGTIIYPAIAVMASALAVLLVACGGDGAEVTANATQVRPSATATRPAPTAAAPASPTAAGEPTTVPAPPTEPPAQPTQASIATVSAPAPTLPPPPAPTTAPPPPPAGDSAAIAAVNTSFVPASLSLGAGTATITLDNQDAGVTHDLVIFDPSGAQLAASDLFAGLDARVITVSLGAPGNYAFKCSVHPLEMRGVIRVQ